MLGESRKADTRRKIRQPVNYAFGLYIKAELGQGGSWRDIGCGKLSEHFKHVGEGAKSIKEVSNGF